VRISVVSTAGCAAISVTDPNALSMPPHVTGAEVKGFALAASKALLRGGVGQMLELARANLRNIPGVGVLVPPDLA
jgi:hypothetical protein